ncbi:GPO family capsid scaffolding protein [Sphingomonas sp.]|jgi:hypothetical protein|uniref:GPO family capsid scaffolding protein n=1 Tax=Sphingomonas sp. TaxID=28214 RepID=UPI002EDA7594
MGTKSKFFRAFVEGQTISDGRTVTAQMIDDAVTTFDVATYSPRINIEHISGYSPEPPFNGYGDVCAVKAQTDDINIAGKTEKRRALYAQVDANDQLVTLSGKDQKPFPSVELTPDYAGSGKFGLVGLAFTDTPASIGTEKLQFSRSAPGTLFSAATDAIEFGFEAPAADSAKVESAIAGFFSALTAKFKGGDAGPVKEEPVKEPANDNFAAFATAMGETVTKSIAAAIAPLTQAQTALDGKFAALEGKLEKTPDSSFTRPPASGGTGALVTDC